MSLFTPDVEKQILEIFNGLDKPVQIVFFKQADNCQTCPEQEKLLKELNGFSDKLHLNVYDMVLHSDEAMNYKINRAPATIIMDETDYGIRFYGFTAGHEFSSLLSTILLVSTGTNINPQLRDLIASISKPVNLKVMTTLTCPYCPQMVQAAHVMAYLNPIIMAEAFDVSEYDDLTQRFQVNSVPMTIINDTEVLDGAVSLPELFLAVLRTADPETYRELDEGIREAMSRKVVSMVEDYVYDIIIIGGGPAGISAAVYSARKGLDVAMISDTFGGQLVYTAKIDNYLGLGGINGIGMIEIFRRQLDLHPIAQDIGSKVVSMKKQGDSFEVVTEEGARYSGRAIILCTGMEYTRLGVPGEDGLIGKGIGFCATCDAPLYRGKNVAVVGGGNSAFTAVRDLLGYADRITLIHRRGEFTADKVLMDEVLSSEKVTLQPSSQVKEFHGDTRLTGLTLEESDGAEIKLGFDGVFIEIGLTPNSEIAKGIVDLNEQGEIMIDLVGSTSVPGVCSRPEMSRKSRRNRYP
ncbi:MAG: FAD-dependent oxidoreductase [Candidatus Bathyarchaeota archaeon]